MNDYLGYFSLASHTVQAKSFQHAFFLLMAWAIENGVESDTLYRIKNRTTNYTYSVKPELNFDAILY